jgi:hypothetical protein
MEITVAVTGLLISQGKGTSLSKLKTACSLKNRSTNMSTKIKEWKVN